jgi:uncharacterized damage-inducible protein DinB
MLTVLRRLNEHLIWADTALLTAMAAAPDTPAEALREFAHILAADETWLARIESRAARTPLWPTLDLAAVSELAEATHSGFTACLEALTEPDLLRAVHYTNSSGISFDSQLRDILYQVFLHAQYHRGKVNLLLRQAGVKPQSLDYIGYIRGMSVATRNAAR